MVTASGTVAGNTGGPAYSSMIDFSIDMLLGGIGSGSRPETRMLNWSDNGQPPTSADAGALIGAVRAFCDNCKVLGLDEWH